MDAITDPEVQETVRSGAELAGYEVEINEEGDCYVTLIDDDAMRTGTVNIWSELYGDAKVLYFALPPCTIVSVDYDYLTPSAVEVVLKMMESLWQR